MVAAWLAGTGVTAAQVPAKPTDPKLIEPVKQSILTVNLNERAELLVPGKDAMKDPKGIEKYLGNEIETHKAKAGGNVDNVVVIIRAPAEARYGDVIRVTDLCIKAGATKILLRVRKPGPDEK
jgi:biopolymer transport protein ExbD